VIKIDFYTVFWREMVVLKRRLWKFLVSRMVSPFLYLVAFGWGLGRSIQMNGGNYLQFVVPGIIALSAMNTSFNSVGTSLNMSRLYHKTLEEYLIAPISAFSVVLGNVLAGSLRGILSSVIILGLAYVFGAKITVNFWFVLVVLLTCFLFASLGVVAAMTIDSHEDMSNFSTFVILPMSFLCGTFFSSEKLPRLFHYFVELLPLTHASQSLRAIALGYDFPAVSLLVLFGYSLVLFAAGVIVVRRVR